MQVQLMGFYRTLSENCFYFIISTPYYLAISGCNIIYQSHYSITTTIKNEIVNLSSQFQNIGLRKHHQRYFLHIFKILSNIQQKTQHFASFEPKLSIHLQQQTTLYQLNLLNLLLLFSVFAARYCSFQKCECRNLCSRKSGKRRGCPCRDIDEKCTSICNCGKIIDGKIVEMCKNRMVRTNM